MLSLDTNILARVILDDDKKQTPVCRELIKRHAQEGNIYLSPFMLIELGWLLQAKKVPKHKIITTLEKLIHAESILVGQKHIVVAALEMYSKSNVGIEDCFITADSQYTANAKLVTYDKALQKASPQCVKP